MASTYNWATQPYETAILCIRIWNETGAGNAFLRGLAHSLLAKIGKVGFVESRGGGKKGEQGKVDASDSLADNDHEAELGSSNVGNGSEMEASAQKETKLAGVLESLISLDPNGNFMDPVDDSVAPNYSKHIKNPMCFAIMRQKVVNQQYSTWRLFVEDFELICYNAMKYNSKQSIIWTLAKDLLQKGEKHLEQYGEVGDSLVAVNQNLESHARSNLKTAIIKKLGSDNVDAKVDQQDTFGVSERVKMAISSAVTGSAEKKPQLPQPPICNNCVKDDLCLIHRSKEGRAKDCTNASVKEDKSPICSLIEEKTNSHASGAESLCVVPVKNVALEDSARTGELKDDQKHMSRVSDGPSCSLTLDDEKDVEVDVESEGYLVLNEQRFDVGDDATECSSSFESTGSGSEGELGLGRRELVSEAESDLHDGSGAFALQEDEDGGVGTSDRGKKALDAEWKKSRRGIEWRCRWLELRMQELQALSVKHEKSIEKLQKEKIWQLEGEVGEGTAARTVPVRILRNHPISRHMRRRKAEDEDLDSYMKRHPLFSRYDKKKRRKSDDGLAEGMVDSQEAQQFETNIIDREIVEEDEEEEELAAAHASMGEENLEQILWQIEALQARVKKAQHLLSRGAPPRKTPPNVPKALPLHTSPRGLYQTSQVTSAVAVFPSQPVSQSGGLVGTPTSASGGLARSSSGVRRRSADYDINNVVMPVNVGTKYVEQIRHVNIETPQWRLVEEGDLAEQSFEQDSSHEDSDDEHYYSMHATMEIKERQQRYMPPLKRNHDGDIQTVGKGNSKLGVGKAAAKMASKASTQTLALPSAGDHIPKKQRSNRNSSRRVPPLDHALPPAGQTGAAENVLVQSKGGDVFGQDVDTKLLKIESDVVEDAGAPTLPSQGDGTG